MELLIMCVGFAVSLCTLLAYVYKMSKQLTKLDKIADLEKSIEDMNKNLVKDLVSISLLTQRVEHLEEEIKEIKKMINAKG